MAHVQFAGHAHARHDAPALRSRGRHARPFGRAGAAPPVRAARVRARDGARERQSLCEKDRDRCGERAAGAAHACLDARRAGAPHSAVIDEDIGDARARQVTAREQHRAAALVQPHGRALGAREVADAQAGELFGFGDVRRDEGRQRQQALKGLHFRGTEKACARTRAQHRSTRSAVACAANARSARPRRSASRRGAGRCG